MSSYKCLTTQILAKGDYALIPLRKEDIYKIKNWRNEQVDVLRQDRLLTDEDQKRYFDQVVTPLFLAEAPSQLLFSLLYKNELIGYGGLVHIQWRDKRGEVSFLVDTNRTNNPETYRNDFIHYLDLIKSLSFETLDLNRIFTETFDIRDYHISILEDAGFVQEGRLREHVIIDASFVDSVFHGFLKKQYNAKG